jgi:hypothetical protein
VSAPIDHAQNERAIGVVSVLLWGFYLGVLDLALFAAVRGWRVVGGLM